ncbi:hypothetical protein H1R20_g13513, partial [Candolleomyces eurysporus]
MGTSTQVVATVQSALFGDSKGEHFNDMEKVVGIPASVTVNVDKPLKSITFMHGAVLDGIELSYSKSRGDSHTTVTHGTSPRSDDSGLTIEKVKIGDNEKIIAFSGLQGTSNFRGHRILQLYFTTYDSKTGKMEVKGPFGRGQGSSPEPFHVTANGAFVAVGGYAIDTDSSLGQLVSDDEDGGLYGLTFFDVAYRSV